jgi:hypothetical protein
MSTLDFFSRRDRSIACSARVSSKSPSGEEENFGGKNKKIMGPDKDAILIHNKQQNKGRKTFCHDHGRPDPGHR